jgi:RND family efflux transporter MFP subunit
MEIDKLAIPEKRLAASSGWYFLLWLLGGLLLLGILTFFVFSDDVTDGEKNEVSNKKEEVAVTPTEPDTIFATGYVVAQRRADVSSKATGRIKLLNVVEGDSISEKSIVAELENEDLKAAVYEAEANGIFLLSRLMGAQAEVAEAKSSLKRASKLNSGKVISLGELDTVTLRRDQGESIVKAIQAEQLLNDARLMRARTELEYSIIRAPFSGTVLTKEAEVGEVVAPFGSSSSTRGAVITMADMNSLQVEADISETSISKIRIGGACSITLDSLPGENFNGEVLKIIPTVDRAKGTVLVKIGFKDGIPKSAIPEMSAKLECKI